MADLLGLLQEKDLIDIGENYQYKKNFLGEKLFPARKTENMLIEMAQLTDDNVPVMAQVHALDAEARIGDRPNYRKIELEKLFIKEKLNTSERITKFLKEMGGSRAENDIKRYVFNDADNLISRVLTRTEVMRWELLSTGKITVDENNVKTVVDFGMDSSHRLSVADWSDPTHDIIGDLNTVKEFSQSEGYPIVRAITSTKIVKYMVQNEGIAEFWKTSNVPLTAARVVQWVAENFGIEFVPFDDVYKTAIGGTKYRYFDENTITFLSTNGAVGTGLFGVTPEEEQLTGFSQQMNVCVSQWKTPDPVAVWTKASALYLPVVRNINSMFIMTVSE